MTIETERSMKMETEGRNQDVTDHVIDQDRVSVIDIGVGAEEEIEMIIIVMITGIDPDGGRETEVQFIKIGEIRLVVMMTGEQAL